MKIKKQLKPVFFASLLLFCSLFLSACCEKAGEPCISHEECCSDCCYFILDEPEGVCATRITCAVIE